MPESGPYGSVRGALSNECPYRDRPLSRAMTSGESFFQTTSAAGRRSIQNATLPQA
jgi:hypothetical protein